MRYDYNEYGSGLVFTYSNNVYEGRPSTPIRYWTWTASGTLLFYIKLISLANSNTSCIQFQIDKRKRFDKLTSIFRKSREKDLILWFLLQPKGIWKYSLLRKRFHPIHHWLQASWLLPTNSFEHHRISRFLCLSRSKPKGIFLNWLAVFIMEFEKRLNIKEY